MFSVFLYPIKGIQKTEATNAITANIFKHSLFASRLRVDRSFSLTQFSSEINQQMPLNYYVNYNFLLSAMWERGGGGKGCLQTKVKVLKS